MLTEIRIYYEGNRLLRPGFDAFFSEIRDRAKQKRCRVRLIVIDHLKSSFSELRPE